MNKERDTLIEILRGGLLNTWPTPEQVAVPSMPKGFENWHWAKLYKYSQWFLKNGEGLITYGQVFPPPVTGFIKGQVFPPPVTGFIKGQVYRVEQDFYMLNDRAEYHSSFPRKGDGVLLHNFIARDRDNDLQTWLFEDHQVFEAITGGVI